MTKEMAEIFFSLTFFAAGLFSVLFSMNQLRLSRLFGDLATSKIRSAAQGMVELKGKAKPSPLGVHYSPYSGTPCCWYRVVPSGSDIREGGIHSKIPFVIEDETGQCLVWPQKAEFEINQTRVWALDDANPEFPLDPARAQTVNRMKIMQPALKDAEKKFLFQEELLTVDESLYAIGEFNTIAKERMIDKLARMVSLHRWKQEQIDASNKRPGQIGSLFSAVKTAQLQHQIHNNFEQLLREKAADPQTIDALSNHESDLNLPIHQLYASKNSAMKIPFIIGNAEQRNLTAIYKRRAIGGIILGFLFAISGAGVAVFGFVG